MADPRLNSVHLQPPRLADFRTVREVLLGLQGTQTLVSGAAQVPPTPSPTAVQHLAGPIPLVARVPYALVDRDYTYPLKVGINTVGRLPDNNVVIHDPCISRRHCAIVVHAASGCELHDLVSRNGTLLNGQPLSGPTRLKSGDEVLLCDRRLIFVAWESSQARSSNQSTRVE